MSVIPPERGPHDCRRHLPERRGGYGSTGEPEGTLRSCPECARWWRCVPCYESLGPVTVWVPVRWYHRRDWARITDLADQGDGGAR